MNDSSLNRKPATFSAKQVAALLGGVVIVAVLLMVVIVKSISGGGGDDGESFTVDGIVNEDLPCRLHRAQVVIQSSSGEDLAVGTLKENPPTDGACPFTFSIPNVPSGEGLYQMTIDNREAPRHTEEELRAGVALSFG